MLVSFNKFILGSTRLVEERSIDLSKETVEQVCKPVVVNRAIVLAEIDQVKKYIDSKVDQQKKKYQQELKEVQKYLDIDDFLDAMVPQVKDCVSSGLLARFGHLPSWDEPAAKRNIVESVWNYLYNKVDKSFVSRNAAKVLITTDNKEKVKRMAGSAMGNISSFLTITIDFAFNVAASQIRAAHNKQGPRCPGIKVVRNEHGETPQGGVYVPAAPLVVKDFPRIDVAEVLKPYRQKLNQLIDSYA